MIVKNRIKKHQEFQKVIEFGKQERSDSLAMYYICNTYGYTRVGISVPKKSGNAVIRNKIKRQIRAFCGSYINFDKSLDLVFIVRKAYNTKEFNKTKSDLEKLVSKLG